MASKLSSAARPRAWARFGATRLGQLVLNFAICASGSQSISAVATWPGHVAFARAAGLGLRPDESFDAVVCDYIRENPLAVRLALP